MYHCSVCQSPYEFGSQSEETIWNTLDQYYLNTLHKHITENSENHDAKNNSNYKYHYVVQNVIKSYIHQKKTYTPKALCITIINSCFTSQSKLFSDKQMEYIHSFYSILESWQKARQLKKLSIALLNNNEKFNRMDEVIAFLKNGSTLLNITPNLGLLFINIQRLAFLSSFCIFHCNSCNKPICSKCLSHSKLQDKNITESHRTCTKCFITNNQSRYFMNQIQNKILQKLHVVLLKNRIRIDERGQTETVSLVHRFRDIWIQRFRSSLSMESSTGNRKKSDEDRMDSTQGENSMQQLIQLSDNDLLSMELSDLDELPDDRYRHMHNQKGIHKNKDDNYYQGQNGICQVFCRHTCFVRQDQTLYLECKNGIIQSGTTLRFFKKASGIIRLFGHINTPMLVDSVLERSSPSTKTNMDINRVPIENESDNIKIQVVNIQSRFFLGQEIDLNILFQRLSNVQLCTRLNRYIKLELHVDGERFVAMIFSSGSVILVGGNTRRSMIIAARRIMRRVQSIGYPSVSVQFSQFEIKNMTITADLGFSVRLESLEKYFPIHPEYEYVSYEPDIHPSAIITVIKQREKVGQNINVNPNYILPYNVIEDGNMMIESLNFDQDRETEMLKPEKLVWWIFRNGKVVLIGSGTTVELSEIENIFHTMRNRLQHFQIYSDNKM